MAGIPSVSAMRANMENAGQIGEINFIMQSEATSNALAGWWQDLFTNKPAFGFATMMSMAGFTPGAAVALNNGIAGCLPINGKVSPMKRYLLDSQITVGTTLSPPCVIYLCDMLLYYPLLGINATPTTLSNTVTLPRYTDGVGVMGIVTTTTTLATSNPALTISYTDSGNNNTSAVMTAVNVAQAASTLFMSNGVGSSPFIPMGAAGQGIKTIDSYTISGGTATGAAAFLLVKPLAAIPIAAARVAQEKDYIFQFPSIPEIQDDACLGMIISFAGTISTVVIQGRFRYGWN